MKYNISGLSDKEVAESRQKNGSNELSPYELESFWSKLWQNFKDPIIIILVAALIIIFVLSLFELTEWYEAVAIGVAVILATFVSTFSEFKNENSFQKLQEEASKINNLVIRESQVTQIPITEIVTGDYVFLQAGDKIPADGQLVEGDVKVNQASLTGESDSITKHPSHDAAIDVSSLNFAGKHDLFRGAVIDEGEGVMRVALIGDKTVYGRLASELSSGENRLSPLQVKLKELAGLISRFGYFAAILIFVTFIFNHAVLMNNWDWELIKGYFSDFELLLPDVLNAMVLSIIIVVAAVPEGLPMMIAIVLALNMRKLLTEKVLVRKLLGIETAGSLNMLFSDKTGTITKGQLEPMMLISSSRTIYNNYDDIKEPLKSLIGFSIVENTASYISPKGDVVGGNSSERALLSFINKDDIKRISAFGAKPEKLILFDSSRKFSATQVTTEVPIPGTELGNLTLIKGAPEIVLEKCKYFINEDGVKMPYNSHGDLTTQIDELADKGIRLIALAVSDNGITDQSSIPEDAALLGIIAIRDEIREESKWSIDEVKRAGVQVIMITGDRKETAAAIASEIGLLEDENDIVLVSSELNAKTDEEIQEILPNIRVIARALPTDKSRLVRLSKAVGRVVGMTGDGVNDSAALKQSDVGIAMGSGSEVSKEAGDIVILDDNFYSITNAIRYGRAIFKSIRKFIIFQLTVNVAAVTTAFLGPMFGIDFPLTIIQLLWINIIMDTLAAIAFGGEPALFRYMEEPPVKREDSILTKYMLSSIFTSGLFITAFSLFFLTYDPLRELFLRDGVPNEAVYLTAFFNVFIFMIIINGFSVRTHKINLLDHLEKNWRFVIVMVSILVLQIIFTYIGGEILRTTALTMQEWWYVFAMALIIIPVDMVRKIIFKAVSKGPVRSV